MLSYRTQVSYLYNKTCVELFTLWFTVFIVLHILLCILCPFNVLYSTLSMREVHYKYNLRLLLLISTPSKYLQHCLIFMLPWINSKCWIYLGSPPVWSRHGDRLLWKCESANVFGWRGRQISSWWASPPVWSRRPPPPARPDHEERTWTRHRDSMINNSFTAAASANSIQQDSQTQMLYIIIKARVQQLNIKPHRQTNLDLEPKVCT